MAVTAVDDAAWDSPWRRHHPAEKVALSLALVVTALVLPVWPASPAVALTAVVLILGGARIPARTLAVVLAAPALFVATGALTIAVGIGHPPGDAWWRWGVLSITPASTRAALWALGHGTAGTLSVMVLATTTPMVDLLTWLRALRIPAPLLEVAALTYRLLFVLLATAVAVHQAQRSRLGRTGWRATTALVGTTCLRAWHRAVALQEGLELRGHDGALVTVAARRERSWRLPAATVGLPVAILALCWWVR